MKPKIILILLLVIFISSYAISFQYSSRLKLLYTAAVANIDISIIRNWSQSGGFNQKIAYGDKGRDVLWLQQALKTDKYIYPEGLETGYFGDLTRNALVKFQTQYNIPITKVLDVKTRAVLNEIFLYELCPMVYQEHPEVSLLAKVNKKTPLPSGYIPPNLSKLKNNITKTSTIICLREDVIPHLEKMLNDAKKVGANISVISGFRNYKNQNFLFNHWLKLLGPNARNLSAVPGFSEHQLGTTIDMTARSMQLKGLSWEFANTYEGIWLQNNAHKYGFTMSYPKDKINITGYSFEPWHWRFVGIEIATKLKNENKTLTEVVQ